MKTTLTVSIGPVVHNLAPAPAPAPAATPAPQRARPRVRPRMMGNEMFFVPDRRPASASGTQVSNPLMDFFNWLFGAS